MADAWKVYSDQMETEGLQVCGIFGKEGSCWTANSKMGQMCASQQEIKQMTDSINSQDFSKGIHIAGKKFTVVRSDPEGKTVTAKASTDKEDEKYLMHIAMSETALVLGGICGANERGAVAPVERVRDHLKNCQM